MSYFFFFLYFSLFFAVVESVPIHQQICPDGESEPLKEGRGQIVPCVFQCPDGFSCEYADAPSGGICCPQIDQLYRLYGEDREQNEGFDLPNVPDVPVEIVDQKTPNVRRSPSATATTPQPTAALLITQPPKPEGLNCRRQKLQKECRGNGIRQNTQFVIRWFAHNGQCQAYSYGYCPGTTVDADTTLRTKDDCEALCLNADEFRNSDLFSFLNFHSQRARAASVPSFSDSGELMDNPAPDDSQLTAFSADEQNGKQMPMDLGLDASEQRESPQKECRHLAAYRSMCPNGFPSQPTIRWHRVDGLCSAFPYGYCHGENVFADLTLKSREECERHCPGISK